MSLNRKMRDYTQQAMGGQVTHPDPKNALGPAQSTYSYQRAGLQSKTPEQDQRMRTRQQFLKEGGGDGKTPFGIVTATERDFQWLERKRKEEDAAQFDAWVGQNFHKGDVAARKWLQETMPEYYEARERIAVDRAKFALRVFLLKLRGPKNEKDLILLWGLQTGRIKLDAGWDKIGFHEPTTDANMPANHARFAKNLFGPYRYLSQSERENQSKAVDNPFRDDEGGSGRGQWKQGEQFPGSWAPQESAVTDLNNLFKE